MYNFMIQEDNPFPVTVDVAAPNVVCCYAYQGAAYANVGDCKEWHVDFLNSMGDVMVSCHNVINGCKNYSVYDQATGRVTVI